MNKDKITNFVNNLILSSVPLFSYNDYNNEIVEVLTPEPEPEPLDILMKKYHIYTTRVCTIV